MADWHIGVGGGPPRPVRRLRRFASLRAERGGVRTPLGAAIVEARSPKLLARATRLAPKALPSTAPARAEADVVPSLASVPSPAHMGLSGAGVAGPRPETLSAFAADPFAEIAPAPLLAQADLTDLITPNAVREPAEPPSGERRRSRLRPGAVERGRGGRILEGPAERPARKPSAAEGSSQPATATASPASEQADATPVQPADSVAPPARQAERAPDPEPSSTPRPARAHEPTAASAPQTPTPAKPPAPVTGSRVARTAGAAEAQAGTASEAQPGAGSQSPQALADRDRRVPPARRAEPSPPAINDARPAPEVTTTPPGATGSSAAKHAETSSANAPPSSEQRAAPRADDVDSSQPADARPSRPAGSSESPSHEHSQSASSPRVTEPATPSTPGGETDPRPFRRSSAARRRAGGDPGSSRSSRRPGRARGGEPAVRDQSDCSRAHADRGRSGAYASGAREGSAHSPGAREPPAAAPRAGDALAMDIDRPRSERAARPAAPTWPAPPRRRRGSPVGNPRFAACQSSVDARDALLPRHASDAGCRYAAIQSLADHRARGGRCSLAWRGRSTVATDVLARDAGGDAHQSIGAAARGG